MRVLRRKPLRIPLPRSREVGLLRRLRFRRQANPEEPRGRPLDREYLSPKEVARTLGVSERTVYNWVRNGELPAKQIGRTWRIKYQDLDRK